MNTLTRVMAQDSGIYSGALELLLVIGGLAALFVLLGWLSNLLAPFLDED